MERVVEGMVRLLKEEKEEEDGRVQKAGWRPADEMGANDEEGGRHERVKREVKKMLDT